MIVQFIYSIFSDATSAWNIYAASLKDIVVIAASFKDIVVIS